MDQPYWVLDTGALMAYAHGVEAVGEALVQVADAQGTVAVPLLCLLEAYSLLDHTEHEYLRMLRRNPTVRTVLPALDVNRTDDVPTIGGIARHVGRLGAAHAIYVALTNTAGVITSRPDQLQKILGEQWEIIEV